VCLTSDTRDIVWFIYYTTAPSSLAIFRSAKKRLFFVQFSPPLWISNNPTQIQNSFDFCLDFQVKKTVLWYETAGLQKDRFGRIVATDNQIGGHMPKPSLEIGADVYYPPHGVVRVNGFEKQKVGSETLSVIWLLLTRKRTFVSVPECNSDRLLKPNEFASKEAIDQIPSILRGPPSRKTNRARLTQLDAIRKQMRTNNFLDLVRCIRDLAQEAESTIWTKNRPRTMAGNLLQEAMEKLRDLLFLVTPERAEKILKEADAIFKEQGFLPLSDF
jgi:RNA polymerase-interacting CarD/CdnL/TRCF family regulator